MVLFSSSFILIHFHFLSYFSFDSGLKYCIYIYIYTYIYVHLLLVLIGSILNLYSRDRYQEKEITFQAMVCIINFENINFGLQKDKVTNAGSAAVLEQQLHLKG